ncbi:MAG: Uma2 family endonuclease [Chloroflexi bacterium]|nr:Uma2 family endonuclease [Chloroflexota bacterium]
MTTTTERLIMTADELFAMPDDGYRYELVRGELRKMAPEGGEHSWISSDIDGSLNPYVKVNSLGKTFTNDPGFILQRDPDHVRAPDVAFVRRERIEVIGKQTGYWPEAPDLAVEVISPHDRYTEVDEKVADWLAAGTRMVIVVNPRNNTVRVHRSPTDVVSLTIDDTLDGGDVVPGWRMPLTEILLD